jgi:hypothetical protein
MKITLEIPDTTACAFLGYVYYTNTGIEMATKGIDTDTIKSGEVINCITPTEKGGEG